MHQHPKAFITHGYHAITLSTFLLSVGSYEIELQTEISKIENRPFNFDRSCADLRLEVLSWSSKLPCGLEHRSFTRTASVLRGQGLARWTLGYTSVWLYGSILECFQHSVAACNNYTYATLVPCTILNMSWPRSGLVTYVILLQVMVTLAGNVLFTKISH